MTAMDAPINGDGSVIVLNVFGDWSSTFIVVVVVEKEQGIRRFKTFTVRQVFKPRFQSKPRMPWFNSQNHLSVIVFVITPFCVVSLTFRMYVDIFYQFLYFFGISLCFLLMFFLKLFSILYFSSFLFPPIFPSLLFLCFFSLLCFLLKS